MGVLILNIACWNPESWCFPTVQDTSMDSSDYLFHVILEPRAKCSQFSQYMLLTSDKSFWFCLKSAIAKGLVLRDLVQFMIQFFTCYKWWSKVYSYLSTLIRMIIQLLLSPTAYHEDVITGYAGRIARSNPASAYVRLNQSLKTVRLILGGSSFILLKWALWVQEGQVWGRNRWMYFFHFQFLQTKRDRPVQSRLVILVVSGHYALIMS